MSEQSLDDFIAWTEKHFTPGFVFLILALTAGTCLVVVTGPFQVNDEITHFRRAYQVSQGQLIATRQGDLSGGPIPEAVHKANEPFDPVTHHAEKRIDTQALSDKLHEPFDPDQTCFSHFLMPAVYAPTLYIPQVIGIVMGRVCGLSALGMLYAGRVTNLLCWIAIVYAAIRITPFYHWVFVLTALLPMNLALAASLSADAATNATTMLLIALIFRLTYGENQPIQEWQRAIVAVLCVFLALAKQTYFPLIGLIFLMPIPRFGSIRNKLIFCGVVVAASLAATLFWSAATKGLFVTFIRGNEPEQMAYLKENPFVFPKLVIDSIGLQWRQCAFAWIGVLGFLDTWLPKWIYWSYPFVLILAGLLDKGRAAPAGWIQKIWIACVILSVFLLIDLSLYLIWTPPRLNEIHGVQGRYYLPLVIPVLFLLYDPKRKLPELPWAPLAATGYSATVLITTCLTVYARFYGPPV